MNNNLLIVGIIVGALVMLIGLNSGLFQLLDPVYCGDNPRQDNCFCNADENKLKVENVLTKYASGPTWDPNNNQGKVEYWFKKTHLLNLNLAFWTKRYICEPNTALFDQKSKTFEGEVIDYAKQKLAELYPSCDMIDCVSKDEELLVTSKVFTGTKGALGRTSVLVECSSANNYYFSQYVFDLFEGGGQFAFCNDFHTLVDYGKSDVPAYLGRLGLDDGRPWFDHSLNYYIESGKISEEFVRFTSECGEVDNGLAIETFISPWNNIKSWELTGNTNGVSSCDIIDETESTATVKCERSCPGPKDSIIFKIYGHFTDSFLDSQACRIQQLDDDSIFNFGKTVICNDDKFEYICREDGTWLRLKDGYMSTDSHCPRFYDAMCKWPTYGYSKWYNPGETLDDGRVCQSNGIWV